MATVKNLKDLITHFSDEQKCRDFLVQQRWGGCPECPYCNSTKWYSIEGGKRFKCGNKDCYKKYSVTVGTFMHSSNIPLTTWFPAVYLLKNNKKGISSVQLAKHLGISQKTSWFMLHRIREAWTRREESFLQNTVEIDEVYVGGRSKNISHKKRAKMKQDNLNHSDNKEMVIGMIERGGELRLLHAGAANNKTTIAPIIHENVSTTASIMTDGEGLYQNIGTHFKSHSIVNHKAKEYVRDGVFHTNTIEGAFGLFRRTVIGTYHKLSPKHLSRYCVEMEARYNTRNLTDGERFERSLVNISTPLSWKELVKKNGLTAETVIEPAIPNIIVSRQGHSNTVCQMFNGKVIATYPSLISAAEATGIKSQNISRVVRGIKKSTGGFQWKYI